MLLNSLKCPYAQLSSTHSPPTIKYSYAHRKRTPHTQSRNQTRTQASMASTILGSLSATRGLCSHHSHHCGCSCLLWLILTILLIVLVPSIRAYQFFHTHNGWANSMNTVQGRCQKFVYASLLCKLNWHMPCLPLPLRTPVKIFADAFDFVAGRSLPLPNEDK